MKMEKMDEEKEKGKKEISNFTQNQKLLEINVMVAWILKVQCYFVEYFLRFSTIGLLQKFVPTM